MQEELHDQRFKCTSFLRSGDYTFRSAHGYVANNEVSQADQSSALTDCDPARTNIPEPTLAMLWQLPGGVVNCGDNARAAHVRNGSEADIRSLAE
jgi:hypothetical protein